MTRSLYNGVGTSGRDIFARPFAGRSWTFDVVLSAGLSKAIAIPAGARFVDFYFTEHVRAVDGVSDTTITLPVTPNTAVANGSDLNPGMRQLSAFLEDGVTPVTHIVVSAPAACNGTVVFFR